jgi:aldehyde:ferredoxin oxidoreductase
MSRWPARAGLAGKILRVDLCDGNIWTEETEKYAQRWLGGRAINSFILLDEMDSRTRWSDPENLLIFGAGALVGTTPGACRMSIDTKSVFTNGKGSANVGGGFAAELKYAGFDHVVVSGKADSPVYLWISDGKAELKDARGVWGKTTYETEELLKIELGDLGVRVACIGPAGERLVRGSIILVDNAKAAAGSGVGCVMGDKNLKALAVRGHGSLRVAEPGVFPATVDHILKKVKASPFSEPMWKNTLVDTIFCDSTNPTWDLLFVYRNGQDDYWEIDKRKKIMDPKTGVPRYRKGIYACFGCPTGGMPRLEIDRGRYKGTKAASFWVNTLGTACMLDISEPEVLLKVWALMNELGLDNDFTTGMLAWAFECYEKGLLTSAETDGLQLKWGNTEVILKTIKKLAYREGIGDLLANGPIEASKKVGRESEYFARHMKGQPSIEPFRIPKGWALSVATSPVAGRHLRGSILVSERFGPKGAIFEPHRYEDQPKYVYWQRLTKEIEDNIGMCVFVGTWSGAYALEVSDYVTLLHRAMGLDLTEEELMRLGQQSCNLEKAFNMLHTNLSRKDDYPPKRCIEEPVRSGPYKGYRCEIDKWDEMLDELYELQGLDKETGWLTKKALAELEMGDVAAKLESAGKLFKG